MFWIKRKKRLLRIIKGKVLPLGSTLNNDIVLRRGSSKIKKIIFISSGHNTKTFLSRDIKIFQNLSVFCRANNLKLIFLEKGNRARYDILKKKLVLNLII